MTTKEAVLGALISKSGEYISGEELAKITGKTRSAVWKAIKALKKEGYVFDAVTNRGYRLNFSNDILNAELVKRQLKHEIDVIYYPSIDSTNSEARRIITGLEKRPLLLIAEEQTGGRGRQGKSFYSPALTGIYMSLVLSPDLPLRNAVTATTAAAVAVCKAIEALTDKTPEIKWVNDVYLNGRKICGILTEAISDFESGRVSSVIIGIGMNVKTPVFPEKIENAGSLGADVKRADLISAITNELYEIAFCDYRSFIDYYREHSMLLGKEIQFIKNGMITNATAKAINAEGGLVVTLENGEDITLSSGEISVRQNQ